MTTTHSIGEILSAGAIPTAEETEHLFAIGKFVASHFGRFAGMSRGDFIRDRVWEPKWLSAMTGVRWSIGMGLGSEFLGFSRYAFGQLLAPGYDAFATDRALVDPYDDDVGPSVESVSARAGHVAFAAGEGLFGVPRAPRASHARRSGASRPGARAGSPRQQGSSKFVWADGGFADASVVRALVSQGVLLADQVAVAESFAGASAKQAGRVNDEAQPSLASPSSSPLVGDKRAFHLDGMRVDDRTPGLASALRVADAATLRANRVVSLSGLGVAQGLASPRVYGFFDAASGSFVNVEPSGSESSGIGVPPRPLPSSFQSPAMSRGVRSPSFASGFGARFLPGGMSALPEGAVPVTASPSKAARPVDLTALTVAGFESESSRGVERVSGVLGRPDFRMRHDGSPAGDTEAVGTAASRRVGTRRATPRTGPVELSLLELVPDVRGPGGALRVFSGFESDGRGRSGGTGAGGAPSVAAGRLAGFAAATSYLPNGDVVARTERAQIASPRVRLLIAGQSAMGVLPFEEEGSGLRGGAPATVAEVVTALVERRTGSPWPRQFAGGDSGDGTGQSPAAHVGTGSEPGARAPWAPWISAIGLDGGVPLPVGRVLSVPEINGGSLFLKALDGDLRATRAEDFRSLVAGRSGEVAGGSGEVTGATGWERALDGWTWIALADDSEDSGVPSSSRRLLATLARGVQVPASVALAASTRTRGTPFGPPERAMARDFSAAGRAAVAGVALADVETSGSDVGAGSANARVGFGRRVVDFQNARTGVLEDSQSARMGGLGGSRGAAGEALRPTLAERGIRGAIAPVLLPVAWQPLASALELRAVLGRGVDRSGVGRLGFEQLLLVAAAQVAGVGDQVSGLRETARPDAFGARSGSANAHVGRGAEFVNASIDGAGPLGSGAARPAAGGARGRIASAIRGGHRIIQNLEVVGLAGGTAAKYPAPEVFWRALGSLNGAGNVPAGGGDSSSERVALDEGLSAVVHQAAPHGRAESASDVAYGAGRWRSSPGPASTLAVGRSPGRDSGVEKRHSFASYGARTLEWVLAGADVAEPESVGAARGMLASALIGKMGGAAVAGSLSERELSRSDDELGGGASAAVLAALERPVMTPREGRVLGGVLGGDGPVARVVARLTASAGHGSMEPSLAAFISGRGEGMARAGAVRDWGGHGSPIALLAGLSRLGPEGRAVVGRALSSAGWSSSALELLDLADGVANSASVEVGVKGPGVGGSGRDRASMRSVRPVAAAAVRGGLSLRSDDAGDSPAGDVSAARHARIPTPDGGRGVGAETVAGLDSGGVGSAVSGVSGADGDVWSRASVVRERVLMNLARVIGGAESIGGRVDRDVGTRTAEVAARLMATAQLPILATAAEGYFGANAPSVARGANRSAARTAGRLSAELSDLVHVAVAGVDVIDLERARAGDSGGAVAARSAAGRRILSAARALSHLRAGRLRVSRFDAAAWPAERRGASGVGGEPGRLVVDAAGPRRVPRDDVLRDVDGADGAVPGAFGGVAARNVLDTSSVAPFAVSDERASGGRWGAGRAHQLAEAVGELVVAPFDLSEALSSALGLSGLSGRLARALSSSTEGPGGARRLLRPLGAVAPDVHGMSAFGRGDLLAGV